MGPYLPDPNDTFEPDLHFDSFDCTWTFGPNPFEGVDLSLDWPSPPEGVRVVGFPWSDYAGHSCSRHGRISHLKSIKKQNIINCTVFENHKKSHSKLRAQTVLPDRSILKAKKWWKMPKFKDSNET